jgi:hypothetical protein
MEDKAQKSKKMQDLEIDAFDLMDGKMAGVAAERLHKQICAKMT